MAFSGTIYQLCHVTKDVDKPCMFSDLQSKKMYMYIVLKATSFASPHHPICFKDNINIPTPSIAQ